MKFKKALATLAAITAGSTAIFAQGLTAAADEVVVDDYAEAAVAVVEDAYVAETPVVAPEVVEAPVAEAVVVEEAPVAEVVVEEAAPVEEVAAEAEAEVADDSLDAEIEAILELTEEEVTAEEEIAEDIEAAKNATAVSADVLVTSDVLEALNPDYKAVLDAEKPAAAAEGINYGAVYSQYFYEKVLPYAPGGYASTTENASYSNATFDFTNNDPATGFRVYNELVGIVGATVYDFANDGVPELVVIQNAKSGGVTSTSEYASTYARIYSFNTDAGEVDDNYSYLEINDFSLVPQSDNAKDGYFDLKISGDAIIKDGWTSDYDSIVDGVEEGDAWTHEYVVYSVDTYDKTVYDDNGNAKTDDDGNEITYKKAYVGSSYALDVTAESIESSISGLIYYNNTIAGELGDANDITTPNTAIDSKAVIAEELKNYTSLDVTDVNIFVKGISENGTIVNGKPHLDVEFEGVIVDEALMSYSFVNGDNPHYAFNDFTGLLEAAPAAAAASASSAASAASGSAASAASASAASASSDAASDAPQTGVNAPVAAGTVGALAVAASVLSVISKKRKND